MPKLGLKAKLLLAALIFVALIAIGAVFFPVPQPEVHLSPNYGGHSPDPFFTLGPFYFSNTLIASCITLVVLVSLFALATRRMKLVPGRLQNMAESVIEWLLNFMEGIAGPDNTRRFFPVVATIFLFVITNAWLGLIPVFNFIGWVAPHPEPVATSFFGDYTGPIVEVALFRGANTDINVPLMLALVSFVCVEYWGITAVGPRHYISKFVRLQQFSSGLKELVKGHVKAGIGAIMSGAIDMFVGALEGLSEFVRIISFTFRLFGNMTAGEVLLMVMLFLIPFCSLFVVFYILELLLGFVQALIFGGLTLVFATMAVAPHETEH